METLENKKENWLMHSFYDKQFELLTDEELGRLIRYINEYVKTGVVPASLKDDRVLQMAFSIIKATIDKETKNYLEKCEKNKVSGSKGGRPKGTKAKGFKENQIKPNGFYEKQEEANAKDNEYDNDLYVCNNTIAARDENSEEIICHLGSDTKCEDCFRCLKKNICKNPESIDFKLNHPNETFDEWCMRKTNELNELLEQMKARGQPFDESILDYDWLMDKKKEEKR